MPTKNQMTKLRIEKIIIEGLFKYLNYSIPFHDGINIMHGINGKGKTTILNIITNILNGDLKKLYNLSFQRIEIYFNEEKFIRIYRNSEDKANLIFFDYNVGNKTFLQRDIRNTNSTNALVNRLKLTPLLLPAQRVSLDETYYDNEIDLYRERYYRHNIRQSNIDIFQPNPQMVSVNKIKSQLVERARKFSIVVNQNFSRLDNLLFEKFFENIFLRSEYITKPNSDNKKILDEINEIKKIKGKYSKRYKVLFRSSQVLEKIEDHISAIKQNNKDIEIFLNLYKQNVTNKSITIERYITPFLNFEKIINNLFEGKKINIAIDQNIDTIFKITTESGDNIEVKHLSSGEKNLILIFYHFLFEMTGNTFFMVDEPELSLHIDWQEFIIKYFNQYSQENQILVVTHSPDILQGYRDYEINLDKCRI